MDNYLVEVNLLSNYVEHCYWMPKLMRSSYVYGALCKGQALAGEKVTTVISEPHTKSQRLVWMSHSTDGKNKA